MYYFIINPNSKSGNGLAIWKKVQRLLEQKRIPYKACLTEYVGHAKQLAHALSQTDKPRTIIVLGGDGTVNEVINGLVLSEHITLGYIPAGSGNDFAKALQLPTDPTKTLECILNRHNILPLPIGQVTADFKSHRFAVSSGIGFDAAVCHEIMVSPLKKAMTRLHVSKLSYLLIGLKQLLLWRPTPLTLYLDQQEKHFFKKAYFIAAMNLPYEGGGFRFCPKAAVTAPILELCVIADLPKWKAICLLGLARLGLHTYFRGAYIYRCHKALIQSAIPLPVHRDGESGGFRTELIISIEKPPLKVIVPVL